MDARYCSRDWNISNEEIQGPCLCKAFVLEDLSLLESFHTVYLH